MKMFRKIIIVIIVLLTIAYLALNIFISLSGGKLLSKNLSQIVGKDVRIGSMNLTPFFSININNLEIGDLFLADKLNIEPSITGLFFGKIGLNKLIITNASVSIVRTGNTEFNVNKSIENIVKNQNKENPQLSFIKQVVVKSAKLSFRDMVSGSSFDIAPIEAAVNTSLLDFKTRFNLSAEVLSKDGRNLGDIKGGGWLNLLKKDMDAEFSLNDLDLVYFFPYFKGFFKELQSGKLQFGADMVSKNNDLTIDCHLETHGLVFREEQPAQEGENKNINTFNDLSGFIFNNIMGLGGAGIFDFSIHTKFDHPKLEGLQFKGNIFKEPIKNIIENPKEAIEQFKKAGEDFEKIGKDLKEQFKNMKDIFKVIKPEETTNEAGPEAQGQEENAPASGSQQ